MEQFTGPLPPPDIMRAYGAVDPSFPERIMAMAEREQAHAHAMDAEEHGLVRFDVGARWKATGRGSQYGLAALVAILIAALACVFHGAVAAGTALGLGDVAAIVAVFVWQRPPDLSGPSGRGAEGEQPRVEPQPQDRALPPGPTE